MDYAALRSGSITGVYMDFRNVTSIEVRHETQLWGINYGNHPSSVVYEVRTGGGWTNELQLPANNTLSADVATNQPGDIISITYWVVTARAMFNASSNCTI